MWKNEENNFEVVRDMEGKLYYIYFVIGLMYMKDLFDWVVVFGVYLDL